MPSLSASFVNNRPFSEERFTGKMKTRHYTIAVFIPMEACPFRCIFCDQKKISGHVQVPTPEDVTEIIRSRLRTISDTNAIVEVGFFGGTFTGLSLQRQEAFLKAVGPFMEEGRVSGIRLSTRPDFIDRQRLDLLEKYRVTTIELGAQSMHDDVLKKAGRGHSAEDTINASRLISEYGFRLGLQMMVGLPGDTTEKVIDTARQMVGLKADDVRIYPLLVIRQTPLERLYRMGKYMPLSLNDAVNIVAKIHKIFEDAGINIIRTGLHPSEGLISGKELVAGPFHVAFKELVLTKLWHEKLEHLLRNQNAENLCVFVAPGQMNYAVGHRSANKIMLLEKYKKVKFITDNSLKERQYHVDFC